MRTISRINHPQMLITVFLWNNKYLIKFEAGPYEQTYKLDEMMVSEPSDIEKLIDEDFQNKVLQRFMDMNSDFGDLLKSL